MKINVELNGISTSFEKNQDQEVEEFLSWPKIVSIFASILNSYGFSVPDSYAIEEALSNCNSKYFGVNKEVEKDSILRETEELCRNLIQEQCNNCKEINTISDDMKEEEIE